MIQVGDRHNRTVIGYHDKHTNQYTLIEKKYPILTDERYTPFLITKDHHFSISTKDVVTLINNYKALASFSKLKNQIAMLLIIPGLIVSLLYMSNILGIAANFPIIEAITTSKFTGLAFWLSVLGVIILWHDYYRTRSHPVQLPHSEKFDEKTVMGIRNNGIQFSRFTILKTVHYLGNETQRLLDGFTSSKGLSCIDLFRTLLQREEIEQLLQLAGLQLNLKNMKDFNIDIKSLPNYQLPAIRSILTYALEEAILTDSNEIKPIHLFAAYMRVFPVLSSYLDGNNFTIELMREIVWYLIDQERKVSASNIFDPRMVYYRTGGVARDWVYGYTFILNKFSKDLTQQVLNDRNRYGIGHDREEEELIAVVGRLSKSNALLIGESGVGKSSIIKGIAQRINHGNVPPQLQRKRIIQLDLNAMLAYAGQSKLEALVQRAMNELAKAGNTILYLDEIQEIIPTKAEESGQSIAGILLPYILENKFPIVGTINYADYKKYFYANESLRQAFESIEVSELTPADTLRILETKIDTLEQSYGLDITFSALTAAIELAQRYVSNRKLPDSAVNTIEAACSAAQAKGIKTLTSEEVAQSVSVQTNIPVENVTVEEATKLLTLEQRMRERVIGQDEAIHGIVEALKRARTDIRDPNKPIGVFLFMGPTGTGKTHLSKVLSEEYFGAKDIVRVDMSEYQEISSISKLLGSTAEEFGQVGVTLLDQVKINPFTVILFDEIEKADAQILNLFLQLFDEGRLTSNSGETVNFTNTIIICTSNIGSRNLLDALERDRTMWEEAKQTALLELRGAIKPELLNRFDKIVVFSPHDINNLISITKLELNQLAKRMGEKGIALEWEEQIPMLIANAAFEPGLGARPLKRLIQDKIEVKIADEILMNGVRPGELVKIRESWLS